MPRPIATLEIIAAELRALLAETDADIAAVAAAIAETEAEVAAVRGVAPAAD